MCPHAISELMENLTKPENKITEMENIIPVAIVGSNHISPIIQALEHHIEVTNKNIEEAVRLNDIEREFKDILPNLFWNNSEHEKGGEFFEKPFEGSIFSVLFTKQETEPCKGGENIDWFELDKHKDSKSGIKPICILKENTTEEQVSTATFYIVVLVIETKTYALGSEYIEEDIEKYGCIEVEATFDEFKHLTQSHGANFVFEEKQKAKAFAKQLNKELKKSSKKLKAE